MSLAGGPGGLGATPALARTVAVAVTVALAAAPLAAAGCARATRTPRDPGNLPAIRVMTYNVNFGIPGDAPTMTAIAASDPDVVFLQETTAEWEQALRSALGSRYPHVAFRHWSGAGGLGLLSRFPVRSVALIRPHGEGFFPAWHLVLEAPAPFGALQALVVHLRPPVSDGGSWVKGHFIAPGIHEREIELFAQALDDRLPTLVVGDFNEEADGKAIAFLARLNMRTALPEFAPGRRTWRWPTSVWTLERQLDHIVYDRRLEPLAVHVVDAGRSDHFPVVGLFTLAAKR
jgi:endonuclease/exonuclease/phosphatase (EEP) superfamily protein YafD